MAELAGSNPFVAGWNLVRGAQAQHSSSYGWASGWGSVSGAPQTTLAGSWQMLAALYYSAIDNANLGG
jgi:hypothetical protein